jgi:cytochrome P450
MPEILLDPLAFSQRMVARHGPLFKFHAMGRWHVHAVGAAAHELVLFDKDGNFSAAEGWGPLVAPLLPSSLLTKDGERHRRSRRLLGEAFRQNAMSGYRDIFCETIEQRVSRWHGRVIDPFAEARLLSFEIAASTFLGLSLDGEAGAALRCFGRVVGGLVSLSYDPRLSLARARGLRAKAKLEAMLAHLVQRKRVAPRADFLSRISLLRTEDDTLLPADEVADIFIALLVAAHDTMSSMLTSCLYFLASEAGWAERLRRELHSKGVERTCQAAEADLPLLDMFCKEAIRLNPPGPVIWRRALRDVILYGRRVPAGTMTGINIMMSHRLEAIWPDAAHFDPLRFSEEMERCRSRFDYVPFGAGIHKCLGMHFAQRQARALVVELLLSAELRAPGPRPRWYAWPSARPRGRLRVEVYPRCRDR